MQTNYNTNRIVGHAFLFVLSHLRGIARNKPVKHLSNVRQNPKKGVVYFETLHKGLISVTKKYGEARLEQACSYGVIQGAYSSKSIASILENNLDQSALTNQVTAVSAPVLAHENIRGSQYYH